MAGVARQSDGPVGGTSTNPQYKTPQQLAAEAEAQRQHQIQLGQKLQEEQGSTDIQTGAQKSILGVTQAHDTAKQAAAIAEAKRAQEFGAAASEKSQTQSEAAKLGLQNASFSGQSALQKAQADAALKSQTQSEGAATASQNSAQGFQSTFLQEQAKIQQEAEARRMAALSGLLGQAGGMMGGGTGTPGPGGTVTGTEDQAISAQEDAARTAAFARAKDQAGLIGRSAISGLQNQMAGRGISRSGIANSQAGQVINQGATQLGDVNREQAISTAANARQRASEQLQAATTRRGQNVSLISGLMNAKAY